jgi:hypothetical protein
MKDVAATAWAAGATANAAAATAPTVTADALAMRWTTDIMLPFWTIEWLALRAGRGRLARAFRAALAVRRAHSTPLARANLTPGSGALCDFAET